MVAAAMTTLRVRAPGVNAPLTHELSTGRAALFGRKPSVDALAGVALPVAAGAITPVTVASALVSENHLLAWSDGTSVHLLDLRSTNGSRWVLPARREVLAPAEDALTVELATNASAPSGGPSPATWTSPDEFRASVRREAQAWIDAQGLPARVSVVPVPSERADRSDHLALGDGWALRFEDLRGASRAHTELPAMRRALEEVWAYVHAQRGEFEAEQDSRHRDLVLESPVMQSLHRQIFKAARRGLSGVLQGESGVGKSALARCFHDHSERRNGPYVSANLGEDTDDRSLFLARLFGACRGAATGVSEREGLVEAAHGGTLFLDEIGLLPRDVQGVLLHFLDTGVYQRFGEQGARSRRADVRVVVGTNADLREAVRKGTFREDLWWRLAGIVLVVPPLRERREDVVALLQRERVNLGFGTRPVYELLTPEARAFVEGWHWPGNFRELRGFVARLPLFAEGTAITRAHCEETLKAGSLTGAASAGGSLTPSIDVPGLGAGRWEDVMPRALEILPRWLAVRPQRSSGEATERVRAPRAFEFRVFVDEVFKPLCMARVLGVEAWDELPRRPDPSYQVLADRIGYGDGKSVQENLRLYLALKRLMREEE
jgi:DNA-binding NtrC family response regulator